MVDNATGVRAMVDAIEGERGHAAVLGWPWTPMVAPDEPDPTRLAKLFA